MAAVDMKPAQDALTAARDLGGTASEKMATVWGRRERLPYLGAIMANATACDTLDWEDCSWSGHPTAGHVPVGLALGEALHCSGKEYLASVVGGFEVYQRIAQYLQPPKDWDHIKKGWGLNSWQILAGSMTAAKLLGLDGRQVNLSIGASAVMTPVVATVMATQMSDFYHTMYGLSAVNGTYLAGMICRGEVDNLYDILDIEGGYSAMMRGFANDGWLDRNVGTEYLFLELLFKHWPANMWIQAPIECLAAIQAEHRFRPEDVEEIYLTPRFQYRNRYCPEGYTSIKQAQFSIPYCLATYLLSGEPGPGWFREDRLRDPAILDLASRVKAGGEEISLMGAFYIFMDGSFPPVTMQVTLKNGTVLQGRMQFPKGHPRNPMEWEDCEKTFRIGAKQAGLTEEKTNRFIQLCQSLETLEDISRLTECLTVE